MRGFEHTGVLWLRLFLFRITNFQNTNKIMIKITDFRVGNKIFLISKNEEFEITDISTHNNTLSSNEYCRELSEFEPIQISEEWLLKLGFEKSFKNDYWFSIRIGDKRLLVSILGNIEIEKWDKTMIGFLSVCEYVHQLQNLFFSLTGEELVFSTEP